MIVYNYQKQHVNHFNQGTLNMKKHMTIMALLLVVFALPLLEAEEPLKKASPKFRKITLATKYYTEGSCVGDFNRDGILDFAAGPFWFEGGDFTRKHEIFPEIEYDPEQYTDNFITFAEDLNGDGWDDIFVCPFPGAHSYWFENPKTGNGHWTKHLALPELGNESPLWGDVRSDGHNGPIFNTNGRLGFGTYRVTENQVDWTFHPVSNEDEFYQRFTHGLGFGDINGDGRNDLVEARGWWEQPKDTEEIPWKFHPFQFGAGPAQMLVYDIDGDGLNDVIAAWDCHNYGLLWYKQIRDDTGNITWQQNEILPVHPNKESDALRISQLHTLTAADFNGDGLMDFVTGKRFWAHGPKGDEEPDAPAVLYWFELERDGQGHARFIPHIIDDDSGAGTQLTVADLNGDNVPDIIAANKKGIFLFLSE